MSEIFALVDCNSFYCSCERLFNPKFKNRPIVVLSNNDGCAVSASKEAKSLGIKIGDPLFKFKEILEKQNGFALSSNYALYGDLSARIMKTLSTMSPSIEVYSIDEAFLDLSGFTSLQDYGHQIKNKVYRHIGIPVSIGIAKTKVLAKLANHIAKKSVKANGVLDLSEKTYHDYALARFPIEDVWGIGRKSAMKLNIIGIKTAKDFRDYTNDKIIQKLLTKVGRQIQDELSGISCLPLAPFADNKKEIICSRQFGQPVLNLNELEEAIADYTSQAAEKLRKQKSVCSFISVYLRTNPFKMNSPQYFNQGFHHFLTGTSDSKKLVKVACRIIKSLYLDGYEYKKVGVLLSQIVDSNNNQISFFDEYDSYLDDELMKTMDKINRKDGRGTIKLAACGTSSGWKLKFEKKSPCFTTRWSEILKAN